MRRIYAAGCVLACSLMLSAVTSSAASAATTLNLTYESAGVVHSVVGGQEFETNPFDAWTIATTDGTVTCTPKTLYEGWDGHAQTDDEKTDKFEINHPENGFYGQECSSTGAFGTPAYFYNAYIPIKSSNDFLSELSIGANGKVEVKPHEAGDMAIQIIWPHVTCTYEVKTLKGTLDTSGGGKFPLALVFSKQKLKETKDTTYTDTKECPKTAEWSVTFTATYYTTEFGNEHASEIAEILGELG